MKNDIPDDPSKRARNDAEAEAVLWAASQQYAPYLDLARVTEVASLGSLNLEPANLLYTATEAPPLSLAFYAKATYAFME